MIIEELEFYLRQRGFRYSHNLNEDWTGCKGIDKEYQCVYEKTFWTARNEWGKASFNIDTKEGTIIVDGTKVYDKVFEDLNDFVTIYKHLL